LQTQLRSFILCWD